jgi:hypothetical protein
LIWFEAVLQKVSVMLLKRANQDGLHFLEPVRSRALNEALVEEIEIHVSCSVQILMRYDADCVCVFS